MNASSKFATHSGMGINLPNTTMMANSTKNTVHINTTNILKGDMVSGENIFLVICFMAVALTNE